MKQFALGDRVMVSSSGGWKKTSAATVVSEPTRRVEAAQDYVVPFVARRMGKSDDDYNLHLAKMTDEVVVQKLEQSFNESRRAALCRDFPALLHAMFDPDSIKPRVTSAVENLEALGAGR